MTRRLVSKVYRKLFKPLYDRVEEAEDRVLNRRILAIDETLDYLVGAQVPGDYVEFGVYKGRTFAHACKRMPYFFPEMRFFAFDSFEGLPEPKGLDAEDGFTSHFYEGQFACSQEEFIKNLKHYGADLDKVSIVKGWFDQTLDPNRVESYGLDKIAVAWVDCDLYESTIPVLKFLTSRVSVGSVILFDDWRCFRNDPDFGEQRACREWLAENPHIKLRELFSFGWHGIAFTVNKP
ncbi:MAG: TylF/MycF family methyltransferase [Acidobacteriota bacterium]|nr:TylF/MycF family methyltransferase [Acidobacteriota bacterium]